MTDPMEEIDKIASSTSDLHGPTAVKLKKKPLLTPITPDPLKASRNAPPAPPIDTERSPSYGPGQDDYGRNKGSAAIGDPGEGALSSVKGKVLEDTPIATLDRCITLLNDFELGPLPCIENRMALQKLTQARQWLVRRDSLRTLQGVKHTQQPHNSN